MASKRILVLGATGGTGRQVVEQAVAVGVDVTVVVRNPAKLSTAAQSVRTLAGDLLRNTSVLNAAVAGQDAVISTLGVGHSFKPAGLIRTTAPAIVGALQQQGVSRLVFMSAFGVGASRQDTPLLPGLFIATLLRQIYADKEAGEEAILNLPLAWTIVHPVGLTDGPKTGIYRVGQRLSLSGFPRISRADVADFLMRQVDDRGFVRKGVLWRGRWAGSPCQCRTCHCAPNAIS